MWHSTESTIVTVNAKLPQVSDAPCGLAISVMAEYDSQGGDSDDSSAHIYMSAVPRAALTSDNPRQRSLVSVCLPPPFFSAAGPAQPPHSPYSTYPPRALDEPHFLPLLPCALLHSLLLLLQLILLLAIFSLTAGCRLRFYLPSTAGWTVPAPAFSPPILWLGSAP